MKAVRWDFLLADQRAVHSAVNLVVLMVDPRADLSAGHSAD